MSDFLKNGDDRSTALAAARQLGAIATQFEQDEPARQVLRKAADQLKRIYAFTRPQKKSLVLNAISEGFQRFDDLIEELGFTDHELRGLMAELIENGDINESRVAPVGGPGGRPYRMYTLAAGVLVDETKTVDRVQ